MDARRVGRLLQRTGATPLVRATRSQREVEYLPPYGDPEVHLVGEAATYVLAGGLAAELVARVAE